MKKITVMLNGLPGNVVHVIARHFLTDDRFEVVPYSMTGPEIDVPDCTVDATNGPFIFHLIRPQDRDQAIGDIIKTYDALISIDFTHPTAVNDNADFYCRHNLPFVMGTTGGDRDRLAKAVRDSSISAVIAPNMAKQIVGFQAMMAYAAETFPDLFKGYRLSIRESHQAGKADTSGTARAMVSYFNRMGIAFSADQIEMERDPERQTNIWGIPSEHLPGHAWHTYTLSSSDGTVLFEFKHNINGRDVYAEGSQDAAAFLSRKVGAGSRGEVFSMMDVLKEGKNTQKSNRP